MATLHAVQSFKMYKKQVSGQVFQIENFCLFSSLDNRGLGEF
jgi:hypothetical protein